MKIRAKLETPYKTMNSVRENVDLPFIQEILDSLIEIESLNIINSDSSKRNFILIGSTSKKLKTLKADIELAFKNKGAYVQLEFLEIKMSVKDTNPSKRL
jgi:hypothetical protein